MPIRKTFIVELTTEHPPAVDDLTSGLQDTAQQLCEIFLDTDVRLLEQTTPSARISFHHSKSHGLTD